MGQALRAAAAGELGRSQAEGDVPTDHITTLWREAYEEGATDDLVRELLLLDPTQANARRYNLTMLHMAAGHHSNEGIALLIAAGADVNAVDDCSETPLHCAAWVLDPEGCRQLLAAGADPTVRDRQGRTPFDVAVNGSIQASREDWELTQRVLASAEAGVLSLQPVRHAEPGAAADADSKVVFNARHPVAGLLRWVVRVRHEVADVAVPQGKESKTALVVLPTRPTATRQQQGICPGSKQLLREEEPWQVHHRLRRVDGGGDELDNLLVFHANCHRQHHCR